MAGSVTITYSETRGGMKSVAWAWTSDSSGDMSGTDTKAVSGEALRWVTNPDGSAAPTDNYDVVVNDVDGTDVANGVLANRDTADSEQVHPADAAGPANQYQAFDGPLSLVVSNAGDTKQGVLRMYYR